MAGFVLSLTVDGIPQILTAFSRWGEYADDLSPAFEEITSTFTDQIEPTWFDTEGQGTWAPLNPRYAAQKERRWPGRPILVASGALLESVTGGTGFVKIITPTALALGTNIPYAIYHQRGTTYMPRRAVIDLSKENRTVISKIVQRYLAKRAREAKLIAKIEDS